MKRKEQRQQKTIISTTPEEWDDRVNAFLATLLDDTRHEPSIIRTQTENGEYQAVIEYWKVFQEPEDIRDEFNLRGEVYRCDDCPHLRRVADKRVKWLECGRGMYATTQSSHEACDWYYEQLAKARR